jgi:hypothetical protein
MMAFNEGRLGEGDAEEEDRESERGGLGEGTKVGGWWLKREEYDRQTIHKGTDS